MADGDHHDPVGVVSPTLHDELTASNADVEAALRQERAQQRQRDLNAITAGIRVRACVSAGGASDSLPVGLSHTQGGVLKVYAAQLVQFMLLVAFLAGSAALVVGLKAAGLSWAGALGVVCGVDFGIAVLVLVALFVRRRPEDGTQLPGFLRSGAPVIPQILDKLLPPLSRALNHPPDAGMHADGG